MLYYNFYPEILFLPSYFKLINYTLTILDAYRKLIEPLAVTLRLRSGLKAQQLASPAVALAEAGSNHSSARILRQAQDERPLILMIFSDKLLYILQNYRYQGVVMVTAFKNRISAFIYFIWSLFLKGFLTLLPIILTAGVLNFSFKVIKKWLHPIYKLEPEFLKAIPFSEFLLTFSFILFLGLILNIFILNAFWAFLENMIIKIPLVRPIYVGTKQLIQAFNPQGSGNGFKQVVMIEFPRKGIFSIAFMTSETPAELSPNSQGTYYNVFIPTTPNPTAGFFLIIDKENIHPTTLTRQEAMALIISGGIIQPQRFTK